jgi:hypothetical protein
MLCFQPMLCWCKPARDAQLLAYAQLAAYEKVRQEKLVQLHSLATSFQVS